VFYFVQKCYVKFAHALGYSQFYHCSSFEDLKVRAFRVAIVLPICDTTEWNNLDLAGNFLSDTASVCF